MTTKKKGMMMNNILIGTDPELFIRSGGKFISSHDLMPGTKVNPYPVDCGAVQVDGVAAEFNIIPASTFDEYLHNIKSVRQQMLDMIRHGAPDAELVAVPTAYFDPEYFESLPEETKLLGCTPDYDAYTGEPNCPPHTDEPFRTGSGHQHIGWTMGEDVEDPNHFGLCCELVKELDRVVYPLTRTYDFDDKRRTLYGAPGSFRPKHYGVEYRAISNAFLQSDDTIELIYRAVRETAEGFLSTRGLVKVAA